MASHAKLFIGVLQLFRTAQLISRGIVPLSTFNPIEALDVLGVAERGAALHTFALFLECDACELGDELPGLNLQQTRKPHILGD